MSLGLGLGRQRPDISAVPVAGGGGDVDPPPPSENYWLLYSTEYVDSDGCPVATDFHLGGSANLLLKRYVNGPNQPMSFDYYINSDGQVRPFSEFNHAAEYPGASVTDVAIAGGPNPSGSFSAPPGPGGSPLSPSMSSWEVHFNNDYYRYSFDIDYTLSVSPVSGTLLSSFYLGDSQIAVLENSVSDALSGSYPSSGFFVDFLYLEVLKGSYLVEGSGSVDLSFTGTFSLLAYPQLLYFARSGGNTYVAILYSRSSHDIAVDYFVNGVLVDTFSAANPSTATDWRSALIVYDRLDIGSGSTGDPCADSYLLDTWSNLDSGVLRTLLDDPGVLQASNATLSYSEQSATSSGSCVLGAPTNHTFDAVQFVAPTPDPDQSASIFFLAAAP